MVNNFGGPGWFQHRVADARKTLESSPSHFKKLVFQGNPAPLQGRVMLFDLARKLLGKDIDNVPQLIGDCCAVSSEHACEYIQLPAILNGRLNQFKNIFPCFQYGAGRVLIGGEKNSMEDGSTAAWTVKACTDYGTVSKDEEGVPAYSAEVAKSYGYYGPPASMLPLAKQHLVKSSGAVTSREDLLNALWNQYPVVVASDVGYDMKAPSPTGFMRYSTNWSHSMMFLGAIWGYPGIPDHVIILNNWGDAHGQLVDLLDNSIKLPIGVIRTTMDNAITMINAGDTWAYSDIDGFPAQPLDPSFFNLWTPS